MINIGSGRVTEKVDEHYRGPVNEGGLEWDGDLACYVPNHWTIGLNVHIKRDGTPIIAYVLLGKPQVRITEGEWKKYRDQYGEDQVGLSEFLLSNYKNTRWTEEDNIRREEHEEIFGKWGDSDRSNIQE